MYIAILKKYVCISHDFYIKTTEVVALQYKGSDT